MQFIMNKIRTKREKRGDYRLLVFIIVDDICCKKEPSTKKTEALSFQYSHETGKSIWCHCVVKAHVVSEGSSYVWDFRPYFREEYCTEHRLPFKSKNDLALEMIDAFPASPDEQVYVLMYSWYTSEKVINACNSTPAHVNDGEMAPSLMKRVASINQTQYFVLDSGYDQMKVYEAARNVKAQAIIPLNLRGEEEPPAGITTNGTPCCSIRYAMTYWGADGDYLKFRCPHATGKVDCPPGMSACSSSNYGMVVKVDAKEDLRRLSSPHRDTKRWKELYNERTSVERCNSRMKTYLSADDLHVWGIKKVTTHQYLNAIVLLVSALSAASSTNEATA